MMYNGKEQPQSQTTPNLLNQVVLSKYSKYFKYIIYRDVLEIVGYLVLQVCYQSIHVISKQSYSAHQLLLHGETQDFTLSDYVQTTATTIFSLITVFQYYPAQITSQPQFMVVQIKLVILPSQSSKKLSLNSMDVMKI